MSLCVAVWPHADAVLLPRHCIKPGTPFSLPLPQILCDTLRMKNLTATICLTIYVLLGCAGVCESAESKKS
jgi:hypothetical protein